MVRHYYERHQDYQAAVQVAREAIEAADRAETLYYEGIGRGHDPKGYLMAERRRSAEQDYSRMREELLEAILHLGDALNAWAPDTAA